MHTLVSFFPWLVWRRKEADEERRGWGGMGWDSVNVYLMLRSEGHVYIAVLPFFFFVLFLLLACSSANF